MAKLLILNGPNLNMLGKREPGIYGTATLQDIQSRCEEQAKSHGLDVDFRQSNHEGELVTWIQEAMDTGSGADAAAIIINAAALTHTSVALHDAIRLAGLPMIEVHISNVYQREEFRHKSFLSGIAEGVICGFGVNSYVLAIDAMAGILKTGK